MLPGELRKAFSGVLKAKKEGQPHSNAPAVNRSALRNLANAARLIEASRRAGAYDAPLPANARSVERGSDIRDERPRGPAPSAPLARCQAVGE